MRRNAWYSMTKRYAAVSGRGRGREKREEGKFLSSFLSCSSVISYLALCIIVSSSQEYQVPSLQVISVNQRKVIEVNHLQNCSRINNNKNNCTTTMFLLLLPILNSPPAAAWYSIFSSKVHQMWR